MKYFFPFSILGFAIILFLSCANNSSLKYPDEDDWFQYGEMTDGNQRYKTVVIGKQTWMAENLNSEVEGSKCYNDSTAYCEKYGRLYNWETAQGVCPDAWHLPSHNEWETLMATVGSPTGIRLKANSVWNKDYNNGINAVGFAALPGGRRGYEDKFSGVGDIGYWWSSNEDYANNTNDTYVWHIGYDDPDASWGGDNKSYMFSVRCLKND